MTDSMEVEELTEFRTTSIDLASWMEVHRIPKAPGYPQPLAPGSPKLVWVFQIEDSRRKKLEKEFFRSQTFQTLRRRAENLKLAKNFDHKS